MEEASEACEMNTQSDNVLSEKNSKKRKLKTPSQVEALERLYTEHKYPTEAMKAELAEEQGLSEKQVSGWFCHRRLKDKNMLKEEMFTNGRQELSSGIIQDRGSALKQDSCSSTKQGEYMHSDVKEVESHRFYGQDYTTPDPTYGNRGQYMHTNARNNGVMDDVSSDSSSASLGRVLPQTKDPYDMKPATFSSLSRDYNSVNIKASKGRGYLKAPGYFPSQDDIATAAISAVKRQLGRYYKEDGPPLGVKFDSLPPGSFDSPIGDAITEPYYVTDVIAQNTLCTSRAHKQVPLDPGYSKYNRTMYPQNSHPKGSLIKQTRCEPNSHKEYSDHRSKRKSSSSNYSNHSSDQISTMDSIVEDAAGKPSVLNRSRHHEMKPKPKVEGMRAGSVSNHRLHPYDGKVLKSEPLSYSRPHSHDDSSSHVLQRGEYLDGWPSSMLLQPSELLRTKNREHSRRMEKDESLYKERRKVKDSIVPVREKMQLKEGISKRGKRMPGEELFPHGYASKTPLPQAPIPWETQIKGYVAETPTVFSDDDTATTNSSTD